MLICVHTLSHSVHRLLGETLSTRILHTVSYIGSNAVLCGGAAPTTLMYSNESFHKDVPLDANLVIFLHAVPYGSAMPFSVQQQIVSNISLGRYAKPV